MSDTIIGTAILSDVNPHDGYEYLFVVCLSESRKTIQTSAIPIRETGKLNPGNYGWSYKENGELLNCNPSLKISLPLDSNREKELFHNTAQWSVKFKRAELGYASPLLHETNKDLFEQYKEQGYKHF